MRINGDRSKDAAGRRCAKLIGTGQKNPRNAERPNCEFLAERPTGRFGDFLTSELRGFFLTCPFWPTRSRAIAMFENAGSGNREDLRI